MSVAQSIKAAVKKGLSPLFKPEPQNLNDWANENFYLSPESSYIEGEWQSAPYQVAIMNAISNDDIREVNVLKSARVGYTKIVVAAMGYFSTHKKRNQVVFQPTDGDAEDFVKDEIDPMLRDCPVVRKQFPWAGKKHKNNTLEKKVLLGSTLNIRGGNSPRNYRRLTVDVAYYDELSGFERDIGGEGSALMLGDKRTEGSAFRKSIRGSTPKIKDLDLTEEAAETAQCYFRFYVPCPHCGTEQYLKFGGKIGEDGKRERYGLKWTDDDPNTVGYCCEHCFALFFNNDLAEISEKGRFICDKSQTWTRNGEDFFDSNDKRVETPRSVAFQVWTIYSPFTTWAQIVIDFMGCKGDPRKLKTFVNTTLGETWEEKADSVDDESLSNRCEDYSAPVPGQAVVLTAGVDVQDTWLQVSVYGWKELEESWLIDRRTIHGDPATPKIWNELDEVLDQTFEHESGTMLPIAAVCIDSGGHFTQEVYDYVAPREIKRRWAIKGVGGEAKATVDAISQPKGKRKCLLYLLGVDDTKSTIFARLKLKEWGAGFVHFPKGTPDEYFKQLTAEKVVKKFLRGFAKREWVKTRARNEELDIFVYALAALKLLNPVWSALQKRLDLVEKAPEQPKQDEPEQLLAQKHRTDYRKKSGKGRKKGRSGGYVNKWKH